MKKQLLYSLFWLTLLCACQKEISKPVADDVNSRVADMIASEELILALTPQLRLLASEVLDGEITPEVQRGTSQGGVGLANKSLDEIIVDTTDRLPGKATSGVARMDTVLSLESSLRKESIYLAIRQVRAYRPRTLTAFLSD